jgi:hypothetical protein
MKSLFVAFLLVSGFVFSACPSPVPAPDTTIPVDTSNVVDSLLVVPPDSTLQVENPGPVVGNDTTALAQ